MATWRLSNSRKLLDRKRLIRQRKTRRVLLEALEPRQLLAVGPQLVGIQPNSGDLLDEGEVLNFSPREFVLRFDDSAGIDPNTLDGIRLIRSGEDGLFERASVATDFGTNGQTLVEFFAVTPGEEGNGIQLRFTAASRSDSRAPIIRVNGRVIDVELNSNPLLETRVEDLLQAFSQQNQSPATQLVYALRLRGSTTIGIGATGANRTLTLGGANAAKAATNFGISNTLEVRFIAREPGNAGLGIKINVTARDRGGAGNPIVTVSGKTISVEINSNPRFPTTVQEFVDALNASNSLSSSLIEAQLVSGSGATRIGAVPITYSPIELSGVKDVEVTPAYVGLGDTNREVIMRFAESLPDDRYRLEILGQGTKVLRNVNGEAFNGGVSRSVLFELELGARIESVVPQPVSRAANGSLQQARNQIDVYFNDDPLIDVNAIDTVNGIPINTLRNQRVPFYLDSSDVIVFKSGAGQASVLNPNFYQLFHTADTLTNTDDTRILPRSVRYYPDAHRVSLVFDRNLDALVDSNNLPLPQAQLRLRIGTAEPAPLPPAVMTPGTDPGDSFATATDLTGTWSPGVAGTQSLLINSEIRNTTPFVLDFPGANDEPGSRQIRYEQHVIGGDTTDGPSVVLYNFQGVLGSLAGSTLLNAITEEQKTRVREVMSLYERYLGIRFVETEDQGLTIAVGDMRAVDPDDGVTDLNAPGAPFYEIGNLLSTSQRAVIIDSQDFDQSDENQFGGKFQRAAMQAVGQLLGIGLNEEAADFNIQKSSSITVPGVGSELILPGAADLIHGRFLYRPDSTDIDLYQFTLPVDGRLKIQTFAERMRGNDNLLDTQIRLYQQDEQGRWVEIAANDDYYSSDSYVELDLGAGNYIVGVSASGNSTYDPTIPGTGLGGRSEGQYTLRMDFQPPADPVLRDSTGTPIDGDADGTPGGTFNFWFRPAGPGNTKFVDKLAAPGGNGTLAAPYKYIKDALVAANPGDVVRIVGNGGADGRMETLADNLAYEIGYDTLGRPLPDGASFNVPKDVAVMIDAGAILKMRRSRVGVGSTSVSVDRSGGSLLVLGTPLLVDAAGNVIKDSSGDPAPGSVYFTSASDPAIGKNANPLVVGSSPRPGDWGGIDFRNRIDASEPGRENDELLGQFNNYVLHADLRYGGGQVVIDGVSQTVTPVQMVDARPTIGYSMVSFSADAALSATPNSFKESDFAMPAADPADNFSLDYQRIGPDIDGNRLVSNSINGLLIRVRTPAGNQLEKMTVQGRFDDTDVVHVLTENLEIKGTPGGAIQDPATGDYVNRLDARLAVDAGTIVKIEGARIDVAMGAQLIAEGTDGIPVVFTSLNDVRYGAGGTFDTANRDGGALASEGDWGGIYVGHTSSVSLDHAVVAFGGGTTRIEGGFADFNAIEIHQADARITNSRIERSAPGTGTATDPERAGRMSNEPAAIFVRGAQPIIAQNIIYNNLGPAISIDVGSLNGDFVDDPGRATGELGRIDGVVGNYGPLMRGNHLDNNDINGVVVRGGELSTEGVWDDTDIVHVVLDEIVVGDIAHVGGLRLVSGTDESLVVKLAGDDAGFTATGVPLDNDDRIGGAVRLEGNPDHPVILTSLEDCTVGAGFTVDGVHQTDTNNTGLCSGKTQTASFVDVIVVMDESASMGFAQQFSVGLIQELDNSLQQAGIGTNALQPNLFGLVGYGNFNQVPRAIPVAASGALFGTSQEYATAAQQLVTNGAIEDGYQALHFALDTYTFRDGAEKFIILVTNEDRDVVDTTLDFNNTLAKLNANDVTLETIVSAQFRDQQGNLALALDAQSNAYLADGQGGFIVSPNGSVVSGSGTTVPDYVDLTFATGGLSGDISQIQAGGLTAQSFGNAIVSSIVGQAGGIAAAPGDWRSVKLDAFSNDRNVMAVNEFESPLASAPASNDHPDNAQFLGGLAPNEKAGDENLRLGFEIDGEIARPGDVDVYSFRAKAGTEVWLDIDRTKNSLDSVVELVDANGRILALSDSSLQEEADPTLLYAASDMPPESVNPLRSSANFFLRNAFDGRPKDLYSTNPQDAGMRVVLPGEPGTENLYHVRIRSSNRLPGDPVSKLVDPASVGQGLTTGSYRLQVRIRELDEIPGSSVNYADIRYAANGIEISGLPGNSPLLGENAEVDETALGAPQNDTFSQAQFLGNLLETNRQAISFAGSIDDDTDVDWYSFDIDYQKIPASALREYFSTVFDLDYADGLGRPDTSMYLFDQNGNLILGGLGSALLDDLANPLNGADNADLSRGSAGNLDPFIGTFELPAGRYFLAVTNSNMVPAVMEAYTNPAAPDAQIRLAPIESVQLIAEDHIDTTGGTTAAPPVTPVLFTDSSIVGYTLADVALYVSQDVGTELTNIYIVNPFTGEQRNIVGRGTFDVQDIAFRPNGQLRAFDRVIETNPGNADRDTLADYIDIDPGTATFTDIGDFGADTHHLEFDQNGVPSAADSDDGWNVEAITFTTFDGDEHGFVAANRPTPPGEVPPYSSTRFINNNGQPGFDRPGVDYFTNVIFEFDENTGAAISDPLGDKTGLAVANGAGSSVRERARVETFTTDASGAIVTRTSQLLAREVTKPPALGGTPTMVIQDGDTFVVRDGSGFPTTFEFDLGPQILFDYNPAAGRHVRDGMQFSLDGSTFEFDTGSVVVIDATDGSLLGEGATVTIEDVNGITRTFEFDSDGTLSNPANVAVPFSSTSTQAELVGALVDAINAESGFAVIASTNSNSNRISLRNASTTTPVTATGTGVSVEGAPGVATAGATRIPILETSQLAELVANIASAMPSTVTVGFDSGRMNFAGAGVGSFSDLTNAGLAVDLGTTGGVGAGNIAVTVLANDSAAAVALRIAKAANDAAIPNLSATASGDQVQFAGVFVDDAGPLAKAGIAPGGIITGIAVVGNTMYAVSDAGGLYRVGNPTSFQGEVLNSWVDTAVDLVGIEFTGLSVGPQHAVNGELRQVLFGIDRQGRIHAFDTNGQLLPIFANGATSVETNLGGANGLAFSTLDFNLWHRSNQRGNEPGHGLPATPNDSREAVDGATSLYFGFEGAVANGVPDLVGPNAPGAQNSYDFPGGAAGVIESQPFDLSGIDASDLPVLYFNYRFDTEQASATLPTGGSANNYMRDALRVYAAGEDGNWILLATNNDPSSPGEADDELDPLVTGNEHVQKLFDNNGQWRQARIPLDVMAGQKNVRLRIEFSTYGGFGYGLPGGRGPEIRTIEGGRLADGQQVEINNQRFEIEMGPTLVMPTGAAISNGDSVTIEGVRYVFTDGTLAVSAPDVPVNFTSTMSAADLAAALHNAIVSSTPAVPVVTGLSYTDESNDTMARAENPGVVGDTVRVEAAGVIGDNTSLADPAEDVDLIRIHLDRGATLTVDVQAGSIGSSLDSYLRLFDADGNQVAANDDRPGSTDSQIVFTAPRSGTYYIGVSGAGNTSYNPMVEGTAIAGSTGNYNLIINVQRKLAPVVNGNRLQLDGAKYVIVPAGSPIVKQGDFGTVGHPVYVSLDMTAAEVAQALQESVANVFAGGTTKAFPVRDNVLDLTGLVTTLDAGPFGATTSFVGDQFGAFNTGTTFFGTTNAANPGALGAQNNAFEGVYLDDFIIGIASRGEMVMNATGGNTNFITDPQLTRTNPPQRNDSILVGPYQVEIRGGQEYGQPLVDGNPDTFDLTGTIPLHGRLANAISIQFNDASKLVAGSTFTLSDGTRTLVFELDDIHDGIPVAAGNIAVPFDTQAIDPVSGTPKPESAGVIAARVRDIINSQLVRSRLDISATLLNGDWTGASYDTITLFGNASATVPPEVGQVLISSGKGDQNRERPQGQVVIANSTFTRTAGFGVVIDAGGRDPATGAPVIGAPRNTIVLNQDQLAPGVVVENNQFLFNNGGGISIAGNPNVVGSPDSAVPFARVINNTIVGGSIASFGEVPAKIYGGQVFNLGDLAFADAAPGYDPNFGEGPPPIAGLDNPNEALGPPDFSGSGEPQPGEGVVSLGNGGRLVLQFTNNYLTGSNDAEPDLMIFEVGDSEEVLVEVSADGVQYTFVGIASGASPLIDIDAFGFNANSRLAYVRLTDVSNQGATTGDSVGADIDAVGALSSVPAEVYRAGGTGIIVENNSTATLMNNVVVNLEVGIDVDASSASTVIGGTVYQRNTNNVAGNATLGQFPVVMNDIAPLFVDASAGNLYLASGAPAIDSSIDSLQDRPSLVAVKQPLGISQSPLLAPDFDLRNQLRVDDPDVDSPSGLGENVFKDRGALERADFVGPTVLLQSPADNDNEGQDVNPALSIVELNNATLDHFDIRIVDGLEPADPNRGTGVDDRTVSSQSVLVFRNNQPLVEGVDYRFGYDATNGVIRLQPLAGIWRSQSVYTIRFLNSREASLTARAPAGYNDGDQFTVIDATGSKTVFEIELGYQIVVPTDDGVTPNLADGATFMIDDGTRRLTFELDLDGVVTPGHVGVSLGASPTVESAGRAIETAIANSGLAVQVGEVIAGKLQLLGSRLVQFLPDTSGLRVTGKTGVQTVFGLQIPLLAGRPDGITDGQTFVIDRGGAPVTFELNTNGVVLPGNVPVQFPPGASADEIGAALVTAIGSAGLGLSPQYDGGGLVRLGGDANTQLDLSNTVLQQTGIAGEPAAVPVVIDLTTQQSAADVASTIKSTMESQNLSGVTITQFGSRLLLEGAQGISGVGANQLKPILDLAGNPLKPNQLDGSTTLTIFLGEGLDYGDAPPPYASAAADNGPRHKVVTGLSLGPTVTTDADAKLPDADVDDGVVFTAGLFAAFSSSATIDVTNTTGQTAYVSMWIDFNGDGVFANSERVLNALAVTQPSTQINFIVPAGSHVGDTYARIRLSTSASAVQSPVGEAPDGEVEDYVVTIQANPFTNPANNMDVNGDGHVSPIDVLQLINYLNDPNTPKTLSLPATNVPPYVDVNGDGSVSPIDPLIVINYLNSLRNPGGEGEGASTAAAWADAAAPAAFHNQETVLASNWAQGLENVVVAQRQQQRDGYQVHPIDLAIVDEHGVADDWVTDEVSQQTANPLDRAWADLGTDDQSDAVMEDLIGRLDWTT